MKNTIDNIEGFYSGNTLGISANQVGYNLKIMMISKYPRHPYKRNKLYDVLINPEIIKLSEEEKLFWEGCISDDKYNRNKIEIYYLKKDRDFVL